VVATGCIERPLLFDNNERPGVMQVGCAHRMARTYGLLPGNEAVFSVGHDLGLEAAVDLCDLGLKINCVADIREDGQNPNCCWPWQSERSRSSKAGWPPKPTAPKRSKASPLPQWNGMVRRHFTCDLLVASAGLTPVTGPFILAQAKMRYDSRTGYFLPAQLPEKMFPAGRITGINDPDAIEASGRLAGLSAAAAAGADVGGAVRAAKDAVAAPFPVRSAAANWSPPR
jgi:sarcosine oxidase subunit alpha